MKIYKDVFSNDILDKLYFFTRDGKQPSGVNFFHYQENLVGVSNSIFNFDVPEKLKNLIIDELIKKNIFLNRPKKWRCFINLFSRNAFIPWHDDKGYKITGTVYLNKDWEKNWGGLFLYENSSDIKALVPEYNKGCFFEPPIMHSTTLTAIDAPMRESLQIFVTEFENK